MNEIKSGRTYSERELAALRRLKLVVEPGRGPAYFAGGPYVVAELQKRAVRAAREAEDALLAADAIEREQLVWPPANAGEDS